MLGLGTSKTGDKTVTFGELVLHSDDGPREEWVAGGHLVTEAHTPTQSVGPQFHLLSSSHVGSS